MENALCTATTRAMALKSIEPSSIIEKASQQSLMSQGYLFTHVDEHGFMLIVYRHIVYLHFNSFFQCSNILHFCFIVTLLNLLK